jgi:serine/threonine protein phosphatase PrpC
MKFTIFQASRQGGRKNNQDRVGYSYSRDALLMVVADGMGGHLHGELAADICVRTLAAVFQRSANPRVDDPEAFLAGAIHRAHEAINDYASEHALLEVPHTTCVVALIQDEMAYWAHVGDSRLYFFADGKLVARTEDHTLVAQMVRDGLLREEDIEHHPERNKVHNCLGGYRQPEVEQTVPMPIHDGETLLLCSDGVWGMISAAEMIAILNSYPLEDAVRHMMDHAEFRGGEGGDNLSLVAMSWGEAKTPGRETVSTLALPDHGFTTLINNRPADHAMQVISDDEIERAIAEIQAAIRRLPS